VCFLLIGTGEQQLKCVMTMKYCLAVEFVRSSFTPLVFVALGMCNNWRYSGQLNVLLIMRGSGSTLMYCAHVLFYSHLGRVV